MTERETARAMSNSSQAESSNPAPMALSGRAGKILSRLVRAGLILALVWLGWVTLQNYYDLLNGPEGGPPQALPAKAFPMEKVIKQLSLNGSWEFSQSGWRSRIETLSQREMQLRLRMAPGAKVTLGPPPEWEVMVLSLRRWMKPLPGGSIHHQGYLFEKPTFQASLWTVRKQGGERAQMVRVAVPSESQWLLYTIVPGDEEVGSSSSMPLLPIPNTCQRLGIRRDRKGAILGELVSFQDGINNLIAFWKDQGWKVEPTAQQGMYLCIREGKSIHAWLVPGPLGEKGLVLFFRPEGGKAS